MEEIVFSDVPLTRYYVEPEVRKRSVVFENLYPLNISIVHTKSL